MTVVRLSKGRYRVFVDLGRDADGRRRRHSEVIRGTKAEAEQRKAETEQQRAKLAEEELARLKALLTDKGIVLDTPEKPA